VLVLVLGAYRATQHKPAFYEEALKSAPVQEEVAGDQLEQNVLELHNNVRKPGRWEAAFSDAQINGWLASNLEKKYPHLLPRGVADPRVAINPNEALVACRYENGSINTVISLALEIHLTDEPNVVAIRVCRARAGALPLPLKNFLDRVSAVAARSGLPLRWAETDGDPVALFKVPSEHEDYVTQGIHLEQVELREGELYLAGHSGEAYDLQRAASIFRPFILAMQ